MEIILILLSILVISIGKSLAVQHILGSKQVTLHSKFKNEVGFWAHKELSSKRKYKVSKTGKRKPRFPGATTFLSSFTDGWHTMTDIIIVLSIGVFALFYKAGLTSISWQHFIQMALLSLGGFWISFNFYRHEILTTDKLPRRIWLIGISISTIASYVAATLISSNYLFITVLPIILILYHLVVYIFLLGPVIAIRNAVNRKKLLTFIRNLNSVDALYLEKYKFELVSNNDYIKIYTADPDTNQFVYTATVPTITIEYLNHILNKFYVKNNRKSNNQ